MYLIINAIEIFAWLLRALIFVNIVISWLPIRKDGHLVQLVYALTEPILTPIRNILHKSPLGGPGMILDFSPIIAIFLIEIVRMLLVSLVGMLGGF